MIREMRPKNNYVGAALQAAFFIIAIGFSKSQGRK